MSGWLRWRHGKRAANTPLAPFYSDPPINLRKTVADSELLALDFETSGLNEKQDRLLSMGWVLISHGRIRMATAGHCVIRSDDRSHDVRRGEAIEPRGELKPLRAFLTRVRRAQRRRGQ